MEAPQEPIGEYQRQDNWLGFMILKLILLVIFTVVFMWFGGFGMLFASGLAAWFLFWPR